MKYARAATNVHVGRTWTALIVVLAGCTPSASPMVQAKPAADDVMGISKKGAAIAAIAACAGAAIGECVEYTRFPNAYATAAEAEASCVSFGAQWRTDGCPRGEGWLGECRRRGWSKHYYSPLDNGPLLCGFENGKWLGRDQAAR